MLALALIALLAASARAEVQHGQAPVRDLTDGSFDTAILDGSPWVIVLYSNSCIHCRRMLAALEETAPELHAEGISAGKVLGGENHVTSNRFHVSKYPSVFFLKGGQSWEFAGPWSAKNLLEFVRTKYRSTDPIPWYRNPTHVVSRAYGLALSVPARLYNIYRHLHVERGWSGIGLVGMGLGSILSAGIVAIAAMDWYYAANPHLLAPRPHHE